MSGNLGGPPAADAAARAVRRAAYIEKVPDYLLSAMFCGLDKLRRSLPKEEEAD